MNESFEQSSEYERGHTQGYIDGMRMGNFIILVKGMFIGALSIILWMWVLKDILLFISKMYL